MDQTANAAQYRLDFFPRCQHSAKRVGDGSHQTGVACHIIGHRGTEEEGAWACTSCTQRFGYHRRGLGSSCVVCSQSHVSDSACRQTGETQGASREKHRCNAGFDPRKQHAGDRGSSAGGSAACFVPWKQHAGDRGSSADGSAACQRPHAG